MYPVTFSAAYAPERSRLTTFFRMFLAIPAFIVYALYMLVGYFTIFGAWCAIVATGRYPEGLYRFNAKLVRMAARVLSYEYLLTDAYPPFHGDEDAGYPVQIHIGEPLAQYSRAKTAFRLIVGIPVMIVAWLYGLLLSFVPFFSWVVIVFTGRQPEGFQDLIRGAMAYSTRAHAYFMLLTETYPPTSLGNELEQPAAAGALPS